MKVRGYYTLIILSFLFLAACTNQTVSQTSSKDVSELTPEEVVKLYFESWNNKDYKTQYQLISDGFKKIDEQAKDLETFSKYMSQYFQQGNSIKVKSVKESYNTGSEAGAEYKITMELKTGKRDFTSTYTLKKRENGWKLIHPYGENIDTS